MSVIHVPRRAPPQPLGRYVADDEWLAKGLVYADAGGIGFDAARLTLPSASICKLRPSSVGIARGFGSTWGNNGADRVVTSLRTHSVQRTWLLSVLINSYNNGRIFEKNTGSGQVEILYATAGGSIQFGRFWSNITAWDMSGPPTGVWHEIALTYDASATTNTPQFYLNGSRVTTTTEIAPNGVLQTSSDPYVLGNRGSDNARGFDGMIGRFTVFDSILSDADIAALSRNRALVFRDAPIRIYSFPTGAISLTINYITASNVTQTGARITLGLTR